MNSPAIEDIFRQFEEKYHLASPVHHLTDGKVLGGFIITFDNMESVIIAFSTEEEDLRAIAEELAPLNSMEALQDLKKLQAFCKPPVLCFPPSQLQ